MRQKIFIKALCVITMIFMLISCSPSESDELMAITEGSFNAAEDIPADDLCIAATFDMLNNPLFLLESIDSLNGITAELVQQFADEVRGEFAPVEVCESSFPIAFIELIENTLYNLTNYNPSEMLFWDEMDSAYFNILESLGNEYFEQDDFINGSTDCINMFHINTAEEDCYVFVRSSEGSAGFVWVELTRLAEGSFHTISSFEIQNNGYGSVVKHGDFYYFVFLQYNYNTKYYDGIRAHRLGLNTQNENILVRYLPTEYVWRNAYDIGNIHLNEYIESMKDVITSDNYLENGLSGTIESIIGDETFADGFMDRTLFEADFANIGFPVLFERYSFIPSDYRSVWHLRSSFYLYDAESSELLNIPNLESGHSSPAEHNLVQLWFKNIDDRIYTFRIFHISHYNYVLSVILIEGDEVTQIRNDIFSSRREFVLTEGEIFSPI